MRERILKLIPAMCMVLFLTESLTLFAQAPADIIVNGTKRTVSGGNWGLIYVANNGDLTLNGQFTADAIVVEGDGAITTSGLGTVTSITITKGKATFGGNLTVEKGIGIASGTFRSTGRLNSCGAFTVNTGATASILGTWSGDELIVRSGGTLSPVVNESTIPGSGKMLFMAKAITIEKGGLINGDFAGNDIRGHAGSFADAGGGSFGGQGAHGWWNASTTGNPYGDDFSYVVEMGASGGQMGGGGIGLVGESITIDGDIRSNGHEGHYISFQYAPGGGSGGGILIDADKLVLNGTLSCNGGNGDAEAGPGGGGRIKVFYGEGGGIALAPKCSVKPGPNHTDKGPAGAGTIYFDAKPAAPTLIEPAAETTVSGTGTVFKFVTRDGSVITDNRNDILFSAIELSLDGFKNIAYRFDQAQSHIGWSSFSSRDGDTVAFTDPGNIIVGKYQWRAVTSDRSLAGKYSEVRTLNVGVQPPDPGPPLDIERAVRLGFQSEKQNYRLQVSNDLENWTNTETVIQGDGNRVEFYLTLQAEVRFYRLIKL
jgi:hypothetical protein